MQKWADNREQPAHYGNKLISGGTIVQKLRLADDKVRNRKAADPSPAFQSFRVRFEGIESPSILPRSAAHFNRAEITAALVRRPC